MEDKKNKINYKENLKKYFSYIWKYKFLFIFLVLFVISIEVFTLIPKFLFKSIIDNGTLFSQGGLIKSEFVNILLILLVIYVVRTLFLLLFTFLRALFMAKLEIGIIYDLKRKFFNHIVSLDHNFHTSHKSGSLISRLSRATGSIEGLTDVFIFQFAPFIVQIVIISASLIYFNWVSALIITLTSIIFISYSVFFQKLQSKDRKKFNEADHTEKGNVADIFTNIDSIKYFGKNNFIRKKYETYMRKTRRHQKELLRWWKWSDTGQIFILTIATIAILYFPLMDFLAGDITIGTISFIYTTFLSFIGALFGFTWGIRGFYRSLTDLNDLFEYEEAKKEIKDKKDAKILKIQKGKIEFKNIDFKYNKKNHLFKNFNLKIPKNKTVALVGQSGCGKSSLIKLLYRFYNLKDGEILIDEENINKFEQESLRSEMSVVPQEAILFDDTIYNNIKFARPNAKKEEVLQAMKFAQLDKLIEELPKGINTFVGERGVKLSGGQKQRVSIARAILADKKVLILDEATSALDSETENEIQKDLETLMKNRTVIVIAHRLSTIMKADLIVVMKDGKILQKGTHRELITEGGEYAKLWNFQKGGFIQEN